MEFTPCIICGKDTSSPTFICEPCYSVGEIKIDLLEHPDLYKIIKNGAKKAGITDKSFCILLLTQGLLVFHHGSWKRSLIREVENVFKKRVR